MTLRGRHDVVLRIVQIGKRVERQQAGPLRAPQVLGNLVTSERSASEWILESDIERSEVAIAECDRRHQCKAGDTVTAILILPGDKEEGLVAADRPAQCGAVLAADKG